MHMAAREVSHRPGSSIGPTRVVGWRDGSRTEKTASSQQTPPIREHAMATIHLHQTTTSTPEQFIAGLTDFGPGRSKVFGNSADRKSVV